MNLSTYPSPSLNYTRSLI